MDAIFTQEFLDEGIVDIESATAATLLRVIEAQLSVIHTFGWQPRGLAGANTFESNIFV